MDEPAREKNTVVTCGLSLGEYTALAYSGVVTFEDGLRLVKGYEEKMLFYVVSNVFFLVESLHFDRFILLFTFSRSSS